MSEVKTWTIVGAKLDSMSTLQRPTEIEHLRARNQRLTGLLRESGEILTLLAVSGTSGEPISLGNDTPSLDQLCYLAARIRAEIDPPADTGELR